MFDSKILGNRIRECRIKSGLSQAELAKEIHIRPSTLCEYESGNIMPSMKVFVDIINKLHCTANDLLLGCTIVDKLTTEDVTEERLNTINKLIDLVDE